MRSNPSKLCNGGVDQEHLEGDAGEQGEAERASPRAPVAMPRHSQYGASASIAALYPTFSTVPIRTVKRGSPCAA